MTAGYDEWAVARTPSLLAFATALVDDVHVADAAVAMALDRVRAAWSRVSRDDPDLRRVDWSSGPARPRAGRPWSSVSWRSAPRREIAEVLGCSESAARRHLQRGLAELGGVADAPSLTAVREPAGDPERRGADAAADPRSRPTGRIAHRPATPHRRAMWLAVGGGARAGRAASRSWRTRPRTPAGVISYPKVAVPTSWRYESYAGVQLEVPDTWGWGAAPMRSTIFAGPRHLGSCGANQAERALAGRRVVVRLEPDEVRRQAREADRPLRDVGRGRDDAAGRGRVVRLAARRRRAAGGRQRRRDPCRRRAAHDRLRPGLVGPSPDPRHRRAGRRRCQRLPDAGGRASRRPVRRDLQPDSMSVCVYSQDTGTAILMYSGALPAASADVVRRAASRRHGLGRPTSAAGRPRAAGSRSVCTGPAARAGTSRTSAATGSSSPVDTRRVADAGDRAGLGGPRGDGVRRSAGRRRPRSGARTSGRRQADSSARDDTGPSRRTARRDAPGPRRGRRRRRGRDRPGCASTPKRGCPTGCPRCGSSPAARPT